MITKKQLLEAWNRANRIKLPSLGMFPTIGEVINQLPDDEESSVEKQTPGKPEQCPKCKGWFKMGVLNKNLGCLVYHSDGSCCHYHDELVEQTPGKPEWVERFDAMYESIDGVDVDKQIKDFIRSELKSLAEEIRNDWFADNRSVSKIISDSLKKRGIE